MSPKKHFLTLVMASMLAITSQVYAEEEFSISITGPDNEQEAPVRRAPRPAQPVARPATPAAPATPVAVTPAAPAQRPAMQGQNTQPNAIPGLIPQSPVEQANLAAQEMRPANLPANFQAQHTVGPRETIWSIAHRYSAPYSDVNEFQAVASIYRNNRDAFNNGDVNQIRRGTTLNIPVAQEMALEQTQTGSDLLSNGTTTLPPLNRSGLYQNATNQGALANNSPIGAVNASSPNLPGSGIQEVPSFVARETLLRDINPTLTFTDQEGMDNPDKEIITDEELASHNAQLTQETVPTITQSSLDLRAIESLLDKTEHNIQTAQKDIYRRLDDNIQRSAQVAKDTATVTAKEEVSELINHYEQVIAELQQSNSDLRSSLSKINKQVEQIRGFQMETADSVAQLDRRIDDTNNPLTGSTGSTSSFESGPVMWILLIVGVLALLMSIGLFVFKSRMRRQHELANSFDDDGDYMDEDDLEISSLLAQNPVMEEEPAPKKEKAKSAPAKEVVEDSAPIVDDGPMSDDMGMDDNFDGGFDGDLDTFGDDGPSNNKKSSAPDFHDEIVMPSSAPLNTASNNAAVAGAVAGAALGGAAMGAAMASSHDDEAQQAWDNAASNVSSTIDKSALNAVNDDWANSLDSNENSASQVDLGSDSGFGESSADGGFSDAADSFGNTADAGGFGQDTGEFGQDAGGFGESTSDGAFGSSDMGGAFGESTADGAFGSSDMDGAFGEPTADGAFGSSDMDGAFGEPTADGGFDNPGSDGSFGDSSGFGEDSGGFGQDSGGFGDDAGGFGDDSSDFSMDSGDFSDNSGGFGDDSGFGDAGFGDDSGGFTDDLGGDDAKQFAASMQGAGGNGFPKTNALASQEVIQASANHDDQSNLSPADAQNNAGDSFAVSGASNLEDQAFNEQDSSNISLNTETNNQFGDLNSPAVEGNGLDGLDFGELADEIDHPENHSEINLDQNNPAPASTVVNAGLGRAPQEQGPEDVFAQNSADQLDFNADSGNSSDIGNDTFGGDDLSFNADQDNNLDFGSLANELDGSDTTQSLDNLDQSAPQTESGNAGDLAEDSLYDSDNSLFGFDSDTDGLSTPEQSSGSDLSTTELTDPTQEQAQEQAPATTEDSSFDSLGSDDSDLAAGFDNPSGESSFDSLDSDDSDLGAGFETSELDQPSDMDFGSLANELENPQDTSITDEQALNSPEISNENNANEGEGDLSAFGFDEPTDQLELDSVPADELDVTAPTEQETAAKQQPEAEAKTDTSVEPSLESAEESPFDTLGSDDSDLGAGFETPDLDQPSDMDFGSLANELENPQDTDFLDNEALNSNENSANENEGDLSAFGFDEPTDQQELDAVPTDELDLTAPTEQEIAAEQQPETKAETEVEPSLESAEESPFDTLGSDNSDLDAGFTTPELDQSSDLDFDALTNEQEPVAKPEAETETETEVEPSLESAEESPFDTLGSDNSDLDAGFTTPELDQSSDLDFDALANELDSPNSSSDELEEPENSAFADLNSQEPQEDALPIEAQDAAEVFNTPEDTFSNNDLASEELPGSESAQEQELPALDAGLSNLTANAQPNAESNFDSLGDEASELASALGQEPNTQIDNNTVFDEPPSELDELSNTFNLDNEHVADLEKEATPQTATEEAKDLADVLGTSLDEANLKDPSELENNPFENLTTPEQQDFAQDSQKDALSEEQPENEPQKDAQSDIFASEPQSEEDSTALENIEPSHPFSLSDMGSDDYPFIMDDSNDQRGTWDTGPVGEAQGNMADDFARFAQNLDNPEAQNEFKTNFEPGAANENAPIDLIYPDEFGLGKDDEHLSALLAEEQGESADVHGFGRLDDDIPSSGDSVDLIMPSGEEMAAHGQHNDSIFDLDESNDILDKMDFTNQDHNMFDEMEDTHFSLDPNEPMDHEQASSDTSNLSKQPESVANTTGDNAQEHSVGDSGIETAQQLFAEDGQDISSLMGEDFRGLDHIDDNKHDNIEDESNDIVMPNPEAMEAPHESLTDVDNAMDSLDHMNLNKMSSDALIDEALDNPNADILEADSQDATPQEPSTTLESATEAPEPIATSEQPQANTSETQETEPSSEDLLTNNDLLAEDPTKEIPQDFQGIDHIEDNRHDNIEDESNDIVMPNLEALQNPHESLENVEEAIDSVNHIDLNNMSSDDLINESLAPEQANNQDGSEQAETQTGNQLQDTSDDMIFPDFEQAQDSGASMLDGVEDALNSIDSLDLGDLSSCPVDLGNEASAPNASQPVSSANDSELKEEPLSEQDSAPVELINPSTIEEVAPQAEDLTDFRGLDSIDTNHHDNIDDEANDYIVPAPEEMLSEDPNAIAEQVEGLDKALDNIDLDHISNDDLLVEPSTAEPSTAEPIATEPSTVEPGTIEPISQSTDSSDTVANAASDEQSETYPESIDTGEETFDLGNANDSQELSSNTQNEDTVEPASEYETELAHEIEEPYLDGSKIEDAQIVSENDQTPDISTNEKSSDNYELGSSDIDFKDLVKDAQTQGLDEVNESPADEIPSLDDEFTTVENPEVFEPSDFTSEGEQAIEDSGSFIEEPMSQDTPSSILNEPEMELEPLVGNNFAELYDSNPNEISPEFENQPDQSTNTQTANLTDNPFNSQMELEPLVGNDFADLKDMTDSGEQLDKPTDTGLESALAADQNDPNAFDADSFDSNESLDSNNNEPLSAETPSALATSAADLGSFEPESETGTAEIERELDGTDNSDEPSMWSVPQDEFDISNISGSDLNVGQEVDSEPNISADNSDSDDSTSEEQLNLPEENTLEEAGFTTNNFDNEAADNDSANADNLEAENFGSFEPELDSSNSLDDNISSGSDSQLTSGDMLDMDPPNFEVGNADDALLDSRIDGSDALADMLSDVPADIPEVIVQQSGSKLHAQNATGEHDLSNGANNLPEGLSLDQDTNVDTNQFDFADFDSDDQDEQDENLVSDMMNGEHQGFNLDKEQALADNDRFVEDMVGDDNLDFEGSNLDSFDPQNGEEPFLQNDDFGSFTDLPGFDESTFDDDKSPNGLAFDDDLFNTDANKN